MNQPNIRLWLWGMRATSFAGILLFYAYVSAATCFGTETTLTLFPVLFILPLWSLIRASKRTAWSICLSVIGLVWCFLVFRELKHQYGAVIYWSFLADQSGLLLCSIRADRGQPRLILRLLKSCAFIVGFVVLVDLATPNFIHTRIVANETSAVGRLRTINRCNEDYKKQHGMYAPSLAALKSLECGFDGESDRVGYIFEYKATVSDGKVIQYRVTALPRTGFETEDCPSGIRSFFTDETEYIRFEIMKPADEHSPPLN